MATSNTQFKVEHGLIVSAGTANLEVATTVNGQFTVANIAALGNTTITGFANVSSSLTVAGAATVNGAFTVNNTASVGNTTVTGFANVTSTLAAGNTTITGFANVSSTLAAGNTTITGFANISSTANVGGAVTLRDTLTVNGALTVGNTAALGNTTISGFANVSSTLNVNAAATVNGAFVVNNTASVGNTTITGFANVSSSLTVAGAATVNGALAVGNTAAVGNTTITGFANIVGSSVSFNASSNVNSTTDTITANAHGFSNGDIVRYIVSAGNTPIGGLANATNYYVIATTSNTFQLAATYGGANINITAGSSETGHTLTPLRVTLETSGNITAPLGAANVGSLRVYGAATVNGAVSVGNTLAVGNTTVNGFANVSSTLNVSGNTTLGGTLVIADNANVTIDTDLLVIDALNNRIGFKNTAPSSADLITVSGNLVFTTANTTGQGLRFLAANTSQNSSIVLVAPSASNSRLSFSTYDGSNSSVNDGGYIFNFVAANATVTVGLQLTSNTFTYKSGNVAHAGNFGIYDVNGTRVGP